MDVAETTIFARAFGGALNPTHFLLSNIASTRSRLSVWLEEFDLILTLQDRDGRAAEIRKRYELRTQTLGALARQGSGLRPKAVGQREP